MGATKNLAKKLRLGSAKKRKSAPRWADLKKFGKRARSRRISVHRTAGWKRSKLQK